MKLKKTQNKQQALLLSAALLIGFFSSLLANVLKTSTELYEHRLFTFSESHPYFFILFPVIGLLAIYFLRHALFKNKPNKGIKEIFEVIKTNNTLPAYKIPSHYLNGFLTVIFGGSTGIEVSTVVATAAIGAAGNKKFHVLRNYKNELICAGAAAGITALFNSPLAGLLFAFEVLSNQRTKTSFLISFVSVFSAMLLNVLWEAKPIFEVTITGWNSFAIPYFILLGIFSGINSVYLTKSVIGIKRLLNRIKKEHHRIILASIFMGIGLFCFPALFGEGYPSIKAMLSTTEYTISSTLLLSFGCILLLKPLITSLTLSGGGDGGVFAPSLFIGAFLGLLLSLVLNHYFNTNVIPMNFMIIGMGAVLSSSIHAPFTAIFVTCGITGNYSLMLPLLIACLVSSFTAKKFVPYTVYSYSKK